MGATPMPATALAASAPEKVPTQNQPCSMDMMGRPASRSACAPSALMATSKQLEAAP